MSRTASFLGSKVRQKIICEKSKIYKNFHNALKIKKHTKLPSKEGPNHENQWKIHYLQLITWLRYIFLRNRPRPIVVFLNRPIFLPNVDKNVFPNNLQLVISKKINVGLWALPALVSLFRPRDLKVTEKTSNHDQLKFKFSIFEERELTIDDTHGVRMAWFFFWMVFYVLLMNYLMIGISKWVKTH
jgi:hypothetical protein